MTTQEFMQSGLLELYCLGTLSQEEQAMAEQMLQHAEVRQAREQIELTLERVAMAGAVAPPAHLQQATRHRIYRQQAGQGNPYPPFIETGVTFNELYAWAASQGIQPPPEEEPMVMHGISETLGVVNFFAWVKDGHPEEWHEDYLEYIVVLEGSCTMDFEGTLKSYQKGDVIEIPLHVKHTAKVTSTKPMWALVQRQFI